MENKITADEIKSEYAKYVGLNGYCDIVDWILWKYFLSDKKMVQEKFDDLVSSVDYATHVLEDPESNDEIKAQAKEHLDFAKPTLEAYELLLYS